MNVTNTKKSLEGWICHRSWNSNHPCDTKRLYESIYDILQRSYRIDTEVFSEAMSELIDQLYPNYSPIFKEELITKYTIIAETISDFLSEMNIQVINHCKTTEV